MRHKRKTHYPFPIFIGTGSYKRGVVRAEIFGCNRNIPPDQIYNRTFFDINFGSFVAGNFDSGKYQKSAKNVYDPMKFGDQRNSSKDEHRAHD